MTSMLEQMARSAHTSARRFYTNMPPWEQMPRDAKEQGMAMASAMLEALTKPTEAMIKAARWLKRTDSEDASRFFVAAEDDVQEIFIDIIRAALEGK